MATTWKKILTKTPIASDLATGATDSYVLTATGGDATAPAWEALPIVNTTYSIKAEDVTGGAELDLDAGGTGAGTDTIKFASAGATTVSRTDASTIKISSTDTQPCGGDGHAKYTDAEALAAVEAESSIDTTCDTPGFFMTAGDGIDVTMTTISTDLMSEGGLVYATGTANARELMVDLSGTSIAGKLAVTMGGTGMTTISAGEMLYATSANTLGKLAAGTSGYFLQASMTGVPTWVSHTDTNTHRTVTAGNNTLLSGETLAFTEGNNITITEDAGAVTITGTDSNVDVDVLETRLGQIDTSITIGNSSSINTTIKGNLIVEGTTVTTKTETLSIADNTIVLNSDLDGGSVDAGFVVQMGTGSDNNPSLWFDTVQAGADDSTGRWVVGSTDDATAAIGGYVADVMQIRIDGDYDGASEEVPVGHMQYDAGNLYVRVEAS